MDEHSLVASLAVSPPSSLSSSHSRGEDDSEGSPLGQSVDSTSCSSCQTRDADQKALQVSVLVSLCVAGLLPRPDPSLTGGEDACRGSCAGGICKVDTTPVLSLDPELGAAGGSNVDAGDWLVDVSSWLRAESRCRTQSASALSLPVVFLTRIEDRNSE